MATILVVEDSPDNMTLFRTLLRMQQHTVVELTSGEGLMSQIEQANPDLVLMDIQLPGRDGYALLREIRQSQARALPVVALTAHAMEGDRERALGAGFNGYITKPVDIRTFAGDVVRFLKDPDSPS